MNDTPESAPAATPAATPGPRRLGEILAVAADWLRRRGVESPRLACELLASNLLRVPRLQLYVDYARELTSPEIEAMRRGVTRLGAGEPVQYVLGEWDFRGHTLKVDRRALVPRPETEQLVQLVLDTVDVWQAASPALVDVGTGSGCIAVSLALERPQGRCTAIDASEEALALARENAAALGVADRIRFQHGEGCAGFAVGSVDAVVSNPPYIATDELAKLPRGIREHEPRLALDGGPDGLVAVRSIAHDAAMVLRPGGWLFLEIGHDQGASVRDLLENLGFLEVAVLEDLAGHPRFARGRLA